MTRAGAEFSGGGVTIMLIDCSAIKLPESSTDAVMVCSPTDRLIFSDAPLPSKPSRLDCQLIVALNSPSSASLAVALN